MTQEDIALIKACEGTPLKLEIPFGESSRILMPDRVAFLKSRRCRKADLNRDGRVNAEDLDLALRLLKPSAAPSRGPDFPAK
jgi:hypothetical protein